MIIIVFIFGLIIGSFLNVCIWRLPRRESIIKPSSRCPYCNNKIRWYDNIPLLSFILLKARCRDCNAKIPFRYFLVELVTAIMFSFVFYYYGLSFKFFIYSLFFSLLLVATFVDARLRIIPDEISVGGIFMGLTLSFIFPEIQGADSHILGLFNSFLGVISGAGITYLTGLIGSFIFKKEAMGFGDVKLMGAIGAFLGWKLAFLCFFIAPFLGAIFGIIILLTKKSHLIPYGPFLSFGAVVSLLYGEKILNILFWRY
jgi:leader peptidase (prepilin peptidase)/N-methyltransferase